MSTDFEKSISSFQAKIDAKREALNAKAYEIKNYLNSPAHTFLKKEALARASTTLESRNRYLDDPVSKDFPSIFNRETDEFDGDTIKVQKPYDFFYGQTVYDPETQTFRRRTASELEARKDVIRLGSQDPGTSLDTYENAKYKKDSSGEYELDITGNKILLPYNENKFEYHKAHYAKLHGLQPGMVTQKMLNDEAEVQTRRLIENIYKGETWADYGVTPKRGPMVPYPDKIQKQINYLEAIIKSKEEGHEDQLEYQEEIAEIRDDLKSQDKKWWEFLTPYGSKYSTQQVAGELNLDENIGEKAGKIIETAWFNSNITELETQIHKIKFFANADRPPIDTSLLTGDVAIDIRKDGVGIYDRDLGTLYNATDGTNINIKLNTPENNASYFSRYNKAFTENLRNNLNYLSTLPDPDGEGFFAEIGYGLLGGMDNIQATGFAYAALIADWTGNTEKANEFLQLYLSAIDDAHNRGVQLPKVEDVNWRNSKQALSKVGRAFGEGIPSIATMMGGAKIFNWLGKKLAQKFVSRKMGDVAREQTIRNITLFSTYAGAFIPAHVMETGGIYGDVAIAGERGNKAIYGSLTGGTIAASLEALFPASFFASKGASKASIDGLKAIFIKRLGSALNNVATQTAKGTVTESVTEGLQSVVSEVTQELIKEGNLNELDAKELTSIVVNSMFQGAVAGGGIRLGSSTISGTANIVFDSDTKQTKLRQREIEEEARTASRESILTEDETRTLDEIVLESDTNLATVVKEVLKATKALNIKENKDINKISSAVELLDQLNRAKDKSEIEQEQKILDESIIKLEEAINNFESGSPEQQLAKQLKVLDYKEKRDLEAIKNEYAIKESETNDADKIAALKKEQQDKEASVIKAADKESRRIRRSGPVLKAERAERESINTAVEKDIKTLNKINKKLEDPSLTKKQREILERRREALAKTINSLSINFELKPDTKDRAEKALDSFEFKNRVIPRTSNKEIKAANTRSAKIRDEVLKANSDLDINPEKLSILMQDFKASYEELKTLRDELLKASLKSTNEKEKRQLGTLIRGLEQSIKKMSTVSATILETQKETISQEKDTANKNQSQASDILNSLKIKVIDTKVKLSKVVISKLTSAETELYAIRNRIANAKVKIDEIGLFSTSSPNRILQSVHKDVLEGSKGWKGLKEYLAQAEKGRFDLPSFEKFKEHHTKKLEAFKEAQARVTEAGMDANLTLFVDRDTFEILEEDNGNTWWIGNQSAVFIDFVNSEVKYIQGLGEYINAVLKNKDSKNNIKKANARIKKINETIQSEVIATEELGDSNLNNEEFTDAVEEESVEVVETEEISKKPSASEVTKPKKEVVPLTKEELIENERTATDNISKLEATIARQEAELKILEDSETLGSLPKNDIEKLKYKIKQSKDLLRQFKRIQKQSLNKLEKIRQEEGILNNVLNKFTDQFFNLALTADNLLKVKDLFTIKDITRTSFFSTNKETNLTTKFIEKQLLSIGMDKDKTAKENAEYVNAVTKVFTSFKKSLVDNVLPNMEDIIAKLDSNNGVYALSNPQLLLTLENGTIPDEVIFAMMLSTMHWAGINQNISRNTPRYKIASLLFEDPKQTNRISAIQYKTFKDSGISIRSAVQDISTEILDTLNIKGKNATEDEVFIKLDLAKLDPSFNEVLSQDAVIAKRAGNALALLSIEAARYLAINKSNLISSNNIIQEKWIKGEKKRVRVKGTIIKGGFFEFHHGRYAPELFENTDNLIKEKDKNGIERIVLNSLVIRDTKATNTILEVFKTNAKNFEIIKGNQTTLNDVFDNPVKEVQERTRDSFFVLTEEQTDVVTALQNVLHKAKEDLYPLFNALSDSTLRTLNKFNILDEQNDEKKEGKEAANNEIDQDIDILRDYVKNNKNKGFYHLWNVMKQGRFQIVSNTINSQRSKMHRAFFYSNNPATVNTEADRAVFKVAVAQALGFKLTTLQDAINQFNAIRDPSTPAGAIIAEMLEIIDALPTTFIESTIDTRLNELMLELLAEGTVSPSMHILEGLVALTQYNTTSFVTTLGFETDGTTSGYAIALMQLSIGTPQELIAQLARVGINAQKGDVKDTFEKFIARGELDVYEFFSDTFYKDLTAPASVEIGKESNRPGNEKEEPITADDLAGIEVLHGEFYQDEVNKKLTKFARDMAKSPVMISNYGAGIQKVIVNVVDSILPDLQDKLAKLQTEYNKATTDTEKIEIERKVRVIEEQLNRIIKQYATDPALNKRRKRIETIKLEVRLKKTGSTLNKFNGKDYQNNLYGVVFDKNQTEAINSVFKNIYTEPFTQTLESILGPLKESSDLIVQAAEVMHFAFMQVYTDGITYIDPKTGKSKEITNLPTKLAIAKELRSLLPQVRGFGSRSDDDVIDLSDTAPDSKKAVQIFTKGIAAPIEVKTEDWNTLENRKFTTLQALTFTPDFVAPGVAAIIRQILNIDSVIIGALAKHNPKGMSIHDAKVSSITDVIPDSIFLNDKFKEIGLNWNILQETLDSLNKIISELDKRDPAGTKNYRENVENDIKLRSFKIKSLEKTLKILEDSKSTEAVRARIINTKQEIEEFQRFTDIAFISRKITEKIDQIKKDHSQIDLANARSSQYYIPESILDLSLVPDKEVANKTGQEKNDEDNDNQEVNTDDVVTTPLTPEDIAKLNAEIANSQGDLKNSNLTPNNINTVPFVWEQMGKLEAKTKTELSRISKVIGIAVEENASKEKIIERITNSQHGLPQEPLKPIEPKFTNNKAFINLVKGRGGINPKSTLGKELKAQDITNKSMPGLFRNDSTTGDLDNMPIEELIGVGFFPEDDGSGYAAYDWVFQRIVDEIGGVVGLTDEDQNTRDQYEEAIEQYDEEKAAYDRAKLLDDNSEELGSLLGSIEQEVEGELKKIYTSKPGDLRSNLLSIFKVIGDMHSEAFYSKEDKNRQQKHLQRVLKDIIGKAGITLDKTTLTLYKGKIKTGGHANITNNSVNVNINKFHPRAYAQQSGQEVYTHELVHILTRFILKNNTEFKRNIKRIREQVRKQIEKTEKRPYEIFLHKDAEGNIIYRVDEASEIEAAKEQYEYVFEKPPADAVLDEFLAYALTNKFLVEYLTDMPSTSIPLWGKDPDDTVVEKLFTFFAEMLKRFGDILQRKHKPDNLQEEIFNLTKEIVEVNQSKRNKISNILYREKVGGIADQGNAILSDFIKTYGSKGIDLSVEKYANIIDTLTRQGKIDTFLANVLYDTRLVAFLSSKNQELIENDSEIQRTLARIYGSFKPGSLKILSSVKTDILGNVNQDFIRLLYKSNKVVDANRRSHKEISQKHLRKLFRDYESLTDEDKTAITRIILKTDLSILLETKAFTIEEMMTLVSNPVELQKAITKYASGLTDYQLLQSDGLSDYMNTNKTDINNLYLNAHNIYTTNPLRGKAKVDKDKVIKQLEIYITLLALQKAPNDAKKLFTVVQEREFDLNDKRNGIHSLLNLHIGFKRDSLKRSFNNNPVLMRKGYIAQITDSDKTLRVELNTIEMQLTMESQGWKYVGAFNNIKGLKNEDWGLYVLDNDPDTARTKGILSMTAMAEAGMDYFSIKARDGNDPGQMKAALNKFKVQELANAQLQVSQKGQHRTGAYKMVPITDEELNIVSYRFNLRQNELETHLKQNLHFDEVLPTMYSQMEDRINSELINQEAIQAMDQYRKIAYKKNPKKFINILGPEFIEEYFDPLPKQAKYEIRQRARFNKELNVDEFLVERGYLDTIFGYVNPSISSFVPKGKLPKTERYLRIAEKFVKEMVQMATVAIVIKIPIVPAANFTSNFITSWMYGVPPDYIAKMWYEGVKELKEYRKMAEALKIIDMDMLADPILQKSSALKLRRATLVADMNNNKVAPFIDEGLFNSITEDINQNEFTYRNKAINKIREKGSKLVTGTVFEIANQAYIGEHTAIFKASMHFLQISDFIARYALYKHQTEEQGMDKKKAYELMIQTFVNYDQPLNRYLGYTNDMGLILFVKYWLRIQRAGLHLMINKPLNAALLFSGNSLLGLDIETILNSSLISGNFMPTAGGLEKILEEVLIPPGLEIIMLEGF